MTPYNLTWIKGTKDTVPYKKTSIIILAYKEPAKFIRMFETLLAHTHFQETMYEIIVVGNNPDSRIHEYLRHRLSAISWYGVLDKNEGSSVGYNIAAKKATGHYLCFFNSDYYMMNDWLKSMIDCFEHQKNIGLISCCTTHTGNIMERCETYQNLPQDYIEAECAIAQMFTTKDIWKEVNGFDETYIASFLDLDFNERIKKKGYKIFVNRKCFGFHDYDSGKPWARGEKEEKHFRKIWGDKIHKWA